MTSEDDKIKSITRLCLNALEDASNTGQEVDIDDSGESKASNKTRFIVEDTAVDDFWWNNQLIRLRSWSATLGVFARGHASLHHRLRYEPELVDTIYQLLVSIFVNLRPGQSYLTFGR